MTLLSYITHKDHGCCTVSELMALGKADKPAMERLKEYAKQEMANKGIAITEK